MKSLRVSLLRMNRRQTRAFVAGIGVMLLIGLYPPWNHVYVNELGARRTVPAGHGGLSAPPVSLTNYNLYGTHIDLIRLFVYWALAAGVTYGTIVAMGDANPNQARLMRRYEADT